MSSMLHQKNPGNAGLYLAIGLALAMVVTRVGHFGEAGGPPDASWAVFFLAGLWLQHARAFAGFFVLAWLADLLAFQLGTPTDCYSLAYLFLIPAYGSLWAAGVALGRFTPVGLGSGSGGIAAVALAGSVMLGAGVLCFLWANLGMWWLAPPATSMTLWSFMAAVGGYLPGYLLTMTLYVVGAMAVAMLLTARRLRGLPG